MTIFPQFDIGQLVYLVTDPEKAGLVTGICIREEGRLLYSVTWGTNEAYHCGFELTAEKTFEGTGTDLKDK